MSSPPDGGAPAIRVVRRRARPISEERQWFLAAIKGQLVGARALAVLAMVVAVASGAWWIVGTTGSPLVGLAFIALGVLLGAATWAFADLMRMIGGAPPTGRSPATPPPGPDEPAAPPPPSQTHRTP